jgi:hypothetical protein
MCKGALLVAPWYGVQGSPRTASASKRSISRLARAPLAQVAVPAWPSNVQTPSQRVPSHSAILAGSIGKPPDPAKVPFRTTLQRT